jgi:hypothetical protein
MPPAHAFPAVPPEFLTDDDLRPDGEKVLTDGSDVYWEATSRPGITESHSRLDPTPAFPDPRLHACIPVIRLSAKSPCYDSFRRGPSPESSETYGKAPGLRSVEKKADFCRLICPLVMLLTAWFLFSVLGSEWKCYRDRSNKVDTSKVADLSIWTGWCCGDGQWRSVSRSSRLPMVFSSRT